MPDIIYQIQEALADRYSIKYELGKGVRATECHTLMTMARSGHADQLSRWAVRATRN